jgi:hypothetical protein
LAATTKPYIRWWWFNVAIWEEDVRYQLDWVKANGFGGVEIAFLHPLPDEPRGPEWLSPEWSRIVAYAKRYAESIGLGCDFTLGSAWPLGGSIVSNADAARDFTGRSPQRLEKSWESGSAKPLRILDHLRHRALQRYVRKMGEALREALSGEPSALFCDSFEVASAGLWTDGLEYEFQERFGYDVRPHMNRLDEDADVRYDYRKFLSECIIREFYQPLTGVCHRLGAYSRVQCLGSPTDLLAAYRAVDVPETEAILFDPPFAQFAASAAAVDGKTIVSAETFTCLYGWKPYPGPAPYIGREQVADLKLLADALFANGVNHVIWHGMPYNPPGGKNEFYATVHVGRDGALARDIPEFNAYLESVCLAMRAGRPYSDVAVYLPLEDNWIRDRLPDELKRPSAEYWWELQYERLPQELAGYQPLWVSMGLLEDADYLDGKLLLGAAEFNWLYVDVEWLDSEALGNILSLAQKGLPVCVRRKPKRPGSEQVVALGAVAPPRSEQYEEDLEKLLGLPNVSTDWRRIARDPPLVAGKDLPEFWCRVDDEEAIFFFAHPKSKEVHYPMRYGQSYCTETIELPVSVSFLDRRTDLRLKFEPYQSLLLRLERNGSIRLEPLAFKPKPPVHPSH